MVEEMNMREFTASIEGMAGGGAFVTIPFDVEKEYGWRALRQAQLHTQKGIRELDYRSETRADAAASPSTNARNGSTRQDAVDPLHRVG
jgi:hypothetical protein